MCGADRALEGSETGFEFDWPARIESAETETEGQFVEPALLKTIKPV
jgi:hypothetical protein